MTDPGPCIGETDKAGKVELLPCPFCGASEAFVTEVDQKSDPRTFYRVRCDNCEGTSFGCYCLTRGDAIREWNARAPLTRQKCEPVAYTNQAQLDYLRTYDEIPMAMWGKRDEKYHGIPLYATPPNVDATQRGKDYVLRAIESFKGDPADNQFQKGYLAALEVIRDEAFSPAQSIGAHIDAHTEDL